MAVVMLLSLCGCSKSGFNKYEYNSARMIRMQATTYVRFEKKESIPEYATSTYFCKELWVKFENDYKNDYYCLCIKYIDFNGEETETRINISYNFDFDIDYI